MNDHWFSKLERVGRNEIHKSWINVDQSRARQEKDEKGEKPFANGNVWSKQSQAVTIACKTEIEAINVVCGMPVQQEG